MCLGLAAQPFRVLWMPQASRSEVEVACKSHDKIITICRLREKFEVRVKAAHEEEVFTALFPSKVLCGLPTQGCLCLAPLAGDSFLTHPGIPHKVLQHQKHAEEEDCDPLGQ